MKTVRTKKGQEIEAKWGLGPLSNGQVFIDLPKVYTIREAADMFEGLSEIVIIEGDTEHVYKGFTELVDVQRNRKKNGTRLIFEKP